MGCTSSATKTLSATPSKEDKSIQFGESGEENISRPIEVIGTEQENRNEINVLPPSDTKENVQLVRNNQSTTSLKPEKDLYTNGHIVETENIDPSETTSADDDHNDTKLKLEEVVGKFIEIVQHETNTERDDADTDGDEPAESKEEDKDKQGTNQTDIPNKKDEEEIESPSEDTEEASPTHSQSSRATRWEALADIAAELPPSLAVDPLTGQIYSLSK